MKRSELSEEAKKAMWEEGLEIMARQDAREAEIERKARESGTWRTGGLHPNRDLLRPAYEQALVELAELRKKYGIDEE